MTSRDHVLYEPGTAQTVAISGSSTQSAAMGQYTSAVRLCATVDCYVAFGTNPTATSSSLYLPANVPEYFAVRESCEVAVLQVSTGGTLSVVEMN
jgi:hypothetical protein